MGPQCELTFDALASHLETHWSSSCSLKRSSSISIYNNEEGPGFPLTGHTSLRAENEYSNDSVS